MPTTFPVFVEQSDHLPGVNIDVDSSVTLYADGRVVINTTTHEELDLRGGHAAIVVLFYDANQHWIWSSTPLRYGVDGKWIGPSDRNDSNTQFVDPDTMRIVSYLAIKHYESPNDAQTDIQNWLMGAQQDFGAVAAIAKDISAL